MRLRVQLLLAIAGTAFTTSLAVTWLSTRQAARLAEESAIRTVGAVAAAREHAVVMLLQRQANRAGALLEDLRRACAEDQACWEQGVRRYVETEPARGAWVQINGKPFAVAAPLKQQIAVPPAQLATLITYPDGARGYVLAARRQTVSLHLHYEATTLTEIFAQRHFLGRVGETFLVDAQGYFVTPPLFAVLTAETRPVPPEAMAACVEGDKSRAVGLDYRGARVVRGYRFVQSLGGACVMTNMDEEEAFAQARKVWRSALAVGGVWALVLLAVTWVVATILARPLTQLTEAAERLGRGEFRVEVDQRLASKETKALATTLQSAAASLEQQRREQQEVIGILSHDLRNPLNAVMMSAAALEKTAETDAQRKQVQRILTSAKRMRRMVSDLLDLSRSRTAAGIPVYRIIADLRDVVQDAVDELRAAHPERTLVTALAMRCRCEIDVERMTQVVSNVVGNALQHSAQESPVTVTLAGEDGHAVLTVHNSGVPIPPETLPRLFLPFERGNTPSRTGLGLGLYIADQIVRAHSGRIEVTSSAEAGTTVRVSVPTGTLPR